MKTNMKNYFATILATFALCGVNSVSVGETLSLEVKVDKDSTFVPTRIVNGGFDDVPWMDYLYDGVRYTLDNATTWKDAITIVESYPNGVDRGWNTTEIRAYLGLFECEHGPSAYGIPESTTHSRFVEMNNVNNAVLWQDLTTHGGDVVLWTLRHGFRSSTGQQTMRVEIGAPNGVATGTGSKVNANIRPETKATYLSDGVTNPEGTAYGHDVALANLDLPSGTSPNWYDVSGIYVIPEGQDVTRFAFTAIKPTNGSGNLLDDLTFSTIIGNLKAVANEDGSVTVTGYWGDENVENHLRVKIDDQVYDLDMSGIHSENFIVTIPASIVGGALSFNVFHQNFEAVERAVSVRHSNQFKVVTDGEVFRAWCTNEEHSVATGCPHHGEENAAEIGFAADNMVWKGAPYDRATFTGNTASWIDAGLAMPTLTYAVRGSGAFELTAPSAVGDYTVRATIDGQSVEADFAIDPIMIDNVRFQQRYPWNGLVDIYADVYGAGGDITLHVSAYNGSEQLHVVIPEAERTVSLSNGLTPVHFVWDAENDIGWNGFRSENVIVCVSTHELGDNSQEVIAVGEEILWSGEVIADERATEGIFFGDDGAGGHVPVGSELKVSFHALDESEPVFVKIVEGHWGPTYVDYTEKFGPVPDETLSCGYISFTATEDVVQAFGEQKWWGGLLLAYGDNSVVTKLTYIPPPQPPAEPAEPVVSAWSGPGRVDLRNPIIVAPGESDEITYSANQWGDHPQDGSVNIHFGSILTESHEELNALPVVFENLTGEGKKAFTYPEKTGSYMFRHKYMPPANVNKAASSLIKQVFVVWYVGKDNPESVYALDRGDGEIYIMGNGYMKDFDECGPWGTGITGVTINPGVWNLGANAFKGCTKMTHAEMPDGLKEYGDGAFSGATGLETIRSDAWAPPQFIGDPFAGVTKEDVIVYVPGEVVMDYENSVDWAPFWNQSKYEFDEFYFEVYSYPGVSRTVTVDGVILHEGADYFDTYVPYGSKVEVTATITDAACLFDDGGTVKTIVLNFMNKSTGVREEIEPHGADWITLQLALDGTPPEDLRDALTYADVDGTNVVTLLKDISTRTCYDRTLVVTNAAVLDLAGHTLCYGNGNASVIGVGQRLSAFDQHLTLRGWLNIVDSVGGGRITKNGGSVMKEESALKAGALGDSVASLYRQAGGIAVMSESVCIMEGGVINGCYGNEVGGVYNEGTFVLAGGEIIGNVSYFDPSCDGIVNVSGGELVITGGKVRDGIINRVAPFKAVALVNAVVPVKPVLAEPVIKISGGYFGTPVTLDRAWIVEGYEAVPNAEFAGYDKQVIETPSDIAQKRIDAMNDIEEEAGLPMTRSDEMDDLVDEAKERIRDAYPAENIETVLAEYLAKVADRYAKDNPGVPQTLTATGTLDLRSRRELPYGVDTVEGITYSDRNWGASAADAVTIAQQNLETGAKMTVVEGLTGASEGTAVQLIGQDTPETGLGHKLFHVVRGTFLESFVTFVFSGFERGTPSNPWDAGEPEVIVSIDDDPNADPPPGKKLDIGGEGELEPNGQDVAWNDRRAEITEIFVASGVVLKASSLAGYPNLQRIVFEDPNYRLPHEAMDGYEYYEEGYGWRWVGMTWPSDGVYVMQFNGRQKVTAFYNEDGNQVDGLYEAWDYGFDPILFSTVPRDLIDTFQAPSTIEPITDENGDLQGWKVTLQNDINSTVYLPDNLGFVVLDLNGHDITGRDGYYDVNSDMRRHGSPAIQIMNNGSEGGEPLVLEIIDSNPDETPDVVGGKGLDGAPAGNGAPAIRVDADTLEGTKVIVGAVVTAKGGNAGAGLGIDEPAGEPAPGAIPADWVETVEGGKVEDGDAADSGVTAWATCNPGVELPSSWLRRLPQGVSYVNGSFWFWRRVGGKTGSATFDFNELPLEMMASEGLTSLNIDFVPGEIEVDTILAPVNFGFRFRGETTTLVAVSGKSIFELAGDTSSDAVVVWENLEFTCREEFATYRWGGAIRMEGGAMQVMNCSFTDCFAADYGGAIFAFGLERDSSITGSRFERCFADGMYGYGGAIYASSRVVGHAEADARVRLTVSSSTFVGNAAVNGGAICTMRDANVDDLINEQPIELVISQTGFMGNAAEYDGGAIFAEGPVTVSGIPRGAPVPVVPDPLPVHPIIVGAVRPTSFYRNFAGGSGGAIAMDCVVGDWFVPAKLSIGESTEFVQNLASNDFAYALGGAIAHLQPGGELEVFGAKFLDNEARATGFNESLAYALGGAVYADSDAMVSFEKTRFFGNWAASDAAYAYGGAAAFGTGSASVTACSFDGNGVAAPDAYFGGSLDFSETDASVKDSTFRGSNVEAIDAYASRLTLTNCVIVGNATLFGDEWADVYATDTPVDMAWSAYGSYIGEGTSPTAFDDEANHNLPESTVDIYDPTEGAEPWLCPTGYVAAAALGLKQDATDIDGVPYGSRFWGYSMGAYECHTMRDMNVGIVVTVDPEEFKWTGLPVEPHSPKVAVYDTLTGSNLVEGVDYTLSWENNVDPTDRAVITAVGTERDYIFSSFTNFWITAYYVDSYLDGETEPYRTDIFGEFSGTNVTAKIAPPSGYAYDPITSTPTGTVRRYDGECPYLRNGQLTLVIHYFKDEGGDEVPDIYQKKMHLKVVNGWWNGELNGADKLYWVTLYDEEGKWSVDGVGHLGENPTNRSETVVLPTAGERPFTDFAASGKWWYLFSSSEFTDIPTPAGLEVRSGSWPFAIFLYDRKNDSTGGRSGRSGRGGTGGTTDALGDYKLRAGLRISQFSYEDGKAAGEAWASVVDETTGQTLIDELLRRTKIDVLATPSLDKGEWSVIGSPTTDGEGGWGTDERPAAETPAQMFFKLRLR